MSTLVRWNSSTTGPIPQGSSCDLHLRHRIVPVLVRNVLWNKVVKNPITKLKQDRMEREKLGAAFQLLAHVILNLHPLIVTVQVGEPVGLTEIGSTDLSSIHEAVLARMKSLIENPPQEEGISIRGLS